MNIIRFFSVILWLTSAITANEIVGLKAPHFMGRNLNASSKEMLGIKSETTTEKAIVLAFFATWCQPCLKELQFLQQLQNEYANVEVIAISVDAQWKEKEKKLYSSLGLTIPVLHDTFKIISRKYHYSGELPYTVYISKEHIVTAITNSFSESEKNKIKELILSL